MISLIILVSILTLLVLHSGVAEYKYYQSVKVHEPKIWAELGSPRYLNVPLVFVSPKGLKLLRSISNKMICDLANKHRQAGMLFLSYVVLVLVGSIVYFKIA